MTIEATDSAGKTTTITRTVTLDTQAPTITAITLTPQTVTTGEVFLVAVTVNEKYLAIADVQLMTLREVETVPLSKMKEVT